jgi:hypothetical protein
VRPTGWLADWARAAADGITGHLDERAAVFEHGYRGYHFEARGVKAHGTGWPLEQCAYWLDGLVRLAYVLQDEALIRKATGRLDLVVNGVNGGGESLIYWQPRSILDNTFNNWAHAHMGRALVAYYQATGDPRILDALVKVYHDYPLPEMTTDVFYPVCGAVNVDPMLETYALSGVREILDDVLTYARRRDLWQLADQWAGGNIPGGHGVIYYENIRVPALMSPWTGDAKMLKATQQALAWGVQRHGLPMGLVSSEEYVAGIGSTRHIEACNVATGPWTDTWMLRLTGDGAYADHTERVLFNAAPATISRDYQTMAYFQCPNRFGSFPTEKLSTGGARDFHPTAGSVFCCVGNSSRIIPNYVMHMWMATLDGGLAAAHYGPNRLQTFVADGIPIIIETHTNYPFESLIRMAVTCDQPAAFPLYLRLPQWSVEPTVAVNGRLIALDKAADGFVKIDRQWTRGDEITIELPMRPQLIRGRETPFPKARSPYRADEMYFRRALAGRDDVNEPYASVTYGPLLFALGIPDEAPNMPVAGAAWNYALDIDPSRVETQVQVIRRPMPERWHWQLDGAPIQLRAPARRFDWQPTDTQPLPKTPITEGEPATLMLVPYGCTKFRLSMFPVTERLWAGRP